MGIIVNQNERERSHLSDRIAAELREKSKRTQQIDNADMVEDSKYAEGLKQTGRYAWIWAVLAALGVFGILAFLLF